MTLFLARPAEYFADLASHSSTLLIGWLHLCDRVYIRSMECYLNPLIPQLYIQWSTSHFTFLHIQIQIKFALFPNSREIYFISSQILSVCRQVLVLLFTLCAFHTLKTSWSKTQKPQSFQFLIKITGFFENTC